MTFASALALMISYDAAAMAAERNLLRAMDPPWSMLAVVFLDRPMATRDR